MFVSVFFFRKSPAHIPNKEERLPSPSQCSFWNPKSLSREAKRYDGESWNCQVMQTQLTFSFPFPLEQARKKASRNKKNIYWAYKCSLSPCNGNPLCHSQWREERKPCRAISSHSISALVSTVLRKNLHTGGVQRERQALGGCQEHQKWWKWIENRCCLPHCVNFAVCFVPEFLSHALQTQTQGWPWHCPGHSAPPGFCLLPDIFENRVWHLPWKKF